MKIHRPSKPANSAEWRIHFAWTPVRISSDTLVWLEKYQRRRLLTDSPGYELYTRPLNSTDPVGYLWLRKNWDF